MFPETNNSFCWAQPHRILTWCPPVVKRSSALCNRHAASSHSGFSKVNFFSKRSLTSTWISGLNIAATLCCWWRLWWDFCLDLWCPRLTCFHALESSLDAMLTCWMKWKASIKWLCMCFEKWQWKLENVEEHRGKKWLRGVTPWKLTSSGSFVYCLWTILLLFIIFLPISWFVSHFLIFLRIIGRTSPALKISRGAHPPASISVE